MIEMIRKKFTKVLNIKELKHNDNLMNKLVFLMKTVWIKIDEISCKSFRILNPYKFIIIIIVIISLNNIQLFLFDESPN